MLSGFVLSMGKGNFVSGGLIWERRKNREFLLNVHQFQKIILKYIYIYNEYL